MKPKSLIVDTIVISIFSILFFLTIDIFITKLLRIRGHFKFFESNVHSGFILKRNFSARFGGPLDQFSSLVNTTKYGTRVVESNECKVSENMNKENIIFVGDSMLAGLEVSDFDHYASRIKNLCLTKGSIINGGVRGTDTHMATANASRIINEYQFSEYSSKIIYGVTLNDFSENLRKGDKQGLKSKFGYIFNNVRYKPKENLRFINFKIFLSDNFYFTKHLIKILSNNRGEHNIYHSEIKNFQCKQLASILDNTIKAKSLKSDFYVFIHPTFSNFKNSEKAEECLRKELNNYENISFLPLHNELKKILPKSLNTEDLYFINDNHYNENGHDLISKALFFVLKDL